MKRINAFLQGEASVLLLLLLALLAQTPHTAAVFHRLADVPGLLAWVHAGFYAIALEFATLLFVVRGSRSLAWLFAVVSVLANAAYYWQADMAAVDMARAALISLALPACIAFYSHDIAQSQGEGAPKAAGAAADKPAPARQKRKAAKVAGRAPATADPAEAEIEALLAGVQMDGTPTMAEYWQASHAQTGKIGSADELTAAHFGSSPRTIRQKRSEEGWQTRRQ